MDFINKVDAYIKENHMLERGMHLAAGVSGGADSMCLLHVLDCLRSRYKLSLLIIHVHHGIRGSEADADAAFVEEECRRRGLECMIVHKDVPSFARKQGISEEEAGRIIRYNIFQEAAQQYGCSRIAVAHNQNDNAETFLFHAFRGSGIRGLKGIMPCRGEIIRPLLCVSREEIETFLAEEKILFCTDSTNNTMHYTRNRIRHQILKTAVEKVNPQAVRHLSETAEELAEIAEFLQEETQKAYKRVRIWKENADGKYSMQSICLSVLELAALPAAIQKAVLKTALEEAAGGGRDIERVHIDILKNLVAGTVGRMANLPRGITAVRTYYTLELQILKEQKQVSADIPKQQILKEQKSASTGILFGIDKECKQEKQQSIKIQEFPFSYCIGQANLHLEVIKYEKNYPIPKNCYTKWFDYDKIRGILVLRTRQPGDFMIIHKDGRRKSLKALLIDKKVPAGERGQLLMLAAGSRILWIPGIRSEEGLYVDENTKYILVAELRKEG